MKFSYRHGFDPDYKNEPIREDAPPWLKSLFFATILDGLIYIDGDSRFPNNENKPLGIKALIERLCAENGQETDDEDHDSFYCYDSLKVRIQNLAWYQFYDVVELIGYLLKENDLKKTISWGQKTYEEFSFSSYRQKVNDLFSTHKIEWKLSESSSLETPIPTDLELKLNQADASLQDRFEPARKHYAKARYFALGSHKDPENSIKESISAVESVCRTYYPSASTLGDALKQMRKESVISPLLITVIEKFYAYTNAEPAVRHGSDKASSVLEYDAELALHISSAFIRTIIQRKK
ncbi:AbiJ-NTD4 domain-containing protein [Rahnella sp. PAMC 25559]|uniref:AbiJ-NTD4 domain-containing protein n=1 Tax=Rahnella sp. PAMC 25559 TaxID=3423225 RepID=UPI003D66F4A8